MKYIYICKKSNGDRHYIKSMPGESLEQFKEHVFTAEQNNGWYHGEIFEVKKLSTW